MIKHHGFAGCLDPGSIRKLFWGNMCKIEQDIGHCLGSLSAYDHEFKTHTQACECTDSSMFAYTHTYVCMLHQPDWQYMSTGAEVEWVSCSHQSLCFWLIQSLLHKLKNAKIMVSIMMEFWKHYSFSEANVTGKLTNKHTISSYSANKHLEMGQAHTSAYIYQHYPSLVHIIHNINFSNKCSFETHFDH